MRIAYVSLHWPRTYESGVGKKIVQQIEIWREFGHEVQFFMHMQTGTDAKNLIPAISTTYKSYPGLFGRVFMEVDRCRAAARLIPEIRRFQPDVIYLRWGMYVFPAQIMYSIAPVVMEINTNDVFQHGLLGSFYGLYNRLTRGILLRRAAGLVSASRELADAPEFATYRRPVCVVTNGIPLDPTRPVTAPNNITPRLVFIGTPDLPWHGVDKLAELARSFPDLLIDLIGYDALDGGVEPPPNLTLHGYLTKDEYEKILAQVDVGIGTLALHRKGMEEASPLKTRECLAHGIPMVLPYFDSDLNDFENPCILRIPNTEQNVREYGRAIRDFAYAMRGKRIQPAEVNERIGMKIKEKLRLEFLKQCQAGGRNPQEKKNLSAE